METDLLSIIIPWQDRGEGDRLRAFEFTRAYYELMGVEVVIGQDPHDGPLNRSKLRNAGAAKAKGWVFAFIDADTLIPYDQILAAAKLAWETGAAVLPFDTGCTVLNRQDSDALISAGQPADWRALGVNEQHNWAYIGADGRIPESLLVGPATVVTRSSYTRVGGYHEGFLGWGEEERDFLYRLDQRVGVKAVAGGAVSLYHRTANGQDQPAYREGTVERSLFLDNQKLFAQRRAQVTNAEVNPSITCPVCSRTSYHPTDIAEGWCAHCNDYTARPSDIERAQRRAGNA